MTEKIIFGTDKIAYIYSSAGVKVQKRVTEDGVVTLTDYLEGFQYVGGALSFLPTAEGFFTAETNAYVYQYRDHLGNVRLSYSDKNENNIIEANEIIAETNYYPFGLAHKGYNEKNDALMKDYKYGYNGKESQEELGLNYYDYGARHYDAAIGRWMSVDPLAEQTMTPYQYVYNNPIMFTDPTGMAGESIGVREVGEGKYEVVSGKADGDKGIYIVDSKGNYNKNSERIGESLTEYSFLSEKGEAVKGAIINTYDTSGIKFLNNEIVNNSDLSQKEYMPNATGGKHYDFKARGREELPASQWNKHHYRGMLFQGIDNIPESDNGATIFASARDIGNVGAGYFSGSKGWNWSNTRTAFDGLQKWQQLNPFAVEGKPSQYAQKIGHNAGYRVWAKKNSMQYRNRERNGLN